MMIHFSQILSRYRGFRQILCYGQGFLRLGPQIFWCQWLFSMFWRSMMIHFRQILSRYKGFRPILCYGQEFLRLGQRFLMPMTSFNVLEVNDDPFQANFVQIQRIQTNFMLWPRVFKARTTNFLMPMTSIHLLEVNDDPFQGRDRTGPRDLEGPVDPWSRNQRSPKVPGLFSKVPGLPVPFSSNFWVSFFTIYIGMQSRGNPFFSSLSMQNENIPWKVQTC